MEKVAPNSRFVGHSTEIIRQSKIKGPLRKQTRFKKTQDSQKLHNSSMNLPNCYATQSLSKIFAELNSYDEPGYPYH